MMNLHVVGESHVELHIRGSGRDQNVYMEDWASTFKDVKAFLCRQITLGSGDLLR